MECLFCKIINGEIKANVLHHDDKVIVIDDINPQAPQHKLIISQKHIATMNDLQAEDNELVGHMVQVAKQLAKQLGISEEGYRLVFNCNAGAGQSVFHIHMHLIGGRRLKWPPG
ncbi:MAG: histidine triad nucleotide-binding protein [Gammaproteobacteria bacterium RIFCSPHIGHO2_12_FULL_41_20]|nr:MAG: histidine triad nucleotide-binding protein [Gammaproteobacteria bacterium RIFCSPHIGHO2_12_FULL_41_20]